MMAYMSDQHNMVYHSFCGKVSVIESTDNFLKMNIFSKKTQLKICLLSIYTFTMYHQFQS